jgi:hypothetical protein
VCALFFIFQPAAKPASQPVSNKMLEETKSLVELSAIAIMRWLLDNSICFEDIRRFIPPAHTKMLGSMMLDNVTYAVQMKVFRDAKMFSRVYDRLNNVTDKARFIWEYCVLGESRWFEAANTVCSSILNEKFSPILNEKFCPFLLYRLYMGRWDRDTNAYKALYYHLPDYPRFYSNITKFELTYYRNFIGQRLCRYCHNRWNLCNSDVLVKERYKNNDLEDASVSMFGKRLKNIVKEMDDTRDFYCDNCYRSLYTLYVDDRIESVLNAMRAFHIFETNTPAGLICTKLLLDMIERLCDRVRIISTMDDDVVVQQQRKWFLHIIRSSSDCC